MRWGNAQEDNGDIEVSSRVLVTQTRGALVISKLRGKHVNHLHCRGAPKDGVIGACVRDVFGSGQICRDTDEGVY